MRHVKLLAVAAACAASAFAVPASAATVFLGEFDGQDCGPGGFSNCYVSHDGTNIIGLGSPVVVKYQGPNGELDEVSDSFPSIDGSEFDITYDPDILSFTYTPGAGDPNIHYFTIKQGDSYSLFYDSDPILSGSVDLSDLGYDSWSHMSFFDTGTPGVPEPASWALMLLGFGAIGWIMRRRNAAEPRMRVLYN